MRNLGVVSAHTNAAVVGCLWVYT